VRCGKRRLGAYLNCLSSAAHAFEDTHLATVIHLTGPVVGPLLALLADRDFCATDTAVQGANGYFDVFALQANPKAAALVAGRAGLSEGEERAVLARLRAKVHTHEDPSINREGAQVRVRLGDGSELRRTVEHAIGSRHKPMSDAQVDAKFLAQAERALDPAGARRALAVSRGVDAQSWSVAAVLHACAV